MKSKELKKQITAFSICIISFAIVHIKNNVQDKTAKSDLQKLHSKETKKIMFNECKKFFEASGVTPTEFLKSYGTLQAFFFGHNGSKKKYHKPFQELPSFIFKIKGLENETLISSWSFCEFRWLYRLTLNKINAGL